MGLPQHGFNQILPQYSVFIEFGYPFGTIFGYFDYQLSFVSQNTSVHLLVISQIGILIILCVPNLITQKVFSIALFVF